MLYTQEDKVSGRTGGKGHRNGPIRAVSAVEIGGPFDTCGACVRGSSDGRDDRVMLDDMRDYPVIYSDGIARDSPNEAQR